MPVNYGNEQELINALYYSFIDKVSQKGIDPYTESGRDVPKFLKQIIQEAVADGNIPSQFIVESNDAAILANLELLENVVVKLAEQMADDAIDANSKELHEWSLSRAIEALCPLWPFLKQPCSQYHN